MNANQLNYRGVSDGTGGVRLVPRKGSAMEKAMRRLYPGVKFWDAPEPLPPMNNLRVPWLPKGSLPTKRNTDRRMRDNSDNPVPLDPDLLELAKQAGSSNIVEQVYAEQRKRDSKRGFDATGCDCTRDQGPSPTKAVRAVTRGVNRVSEFGEEFNRDSRVRRRRARDQQLPDPDQMDPDEHQEPDGDEGQVIATMEAPPDGMRFALYEEGDQVAVVLEPDLGERDDPDLQTNDRTYRHRISDGKDKTLVRINQINRGHHVRDAVISTLLRHRCLPGNKIVLRENEFGSIDVRLISWNPGEHMIINPQGSEELDDSDAQEMGAASWLPQPEKDDPQQLRQPTPTFRGDSAYRVSDTYRLSQMNREAKAFWSAKR